MSVRGSALRPLPAALVWMGAVCWSIRDVRALPDNALETAEDHLNGSLYFPLMRTTKETHIADMAFQVVN